jgi:hypothetical protein
VALPWSMPTTSGLSAGVRIRRVVTWLTFIGLLLASGGRRWGGQAPAKARSSAWATSAIKSSASSMPTA